MGVKSSIAHGIDRNKAIAFKAVPDVLKHGEVIDYTENYKNRGYDTAVFSAPFSINNKPFYLAAVVIVDDKVNEYYLHEVVIKKQNEDETPFKTGTSQKTTPSDASSSIYTLLEKLQNVNKPYVVSFVINNYTSSVQSIDVLYSVNAKTEPAGSLSSKVSTLSTDSKISIFNLLDYVNKYTSN